MNPSILTQYQISLALLLRRAGFDYMEVAALVAHYEKEEQQIKDNLLVWIYDKNPTKQEVLEFLSENG